MSSPQALKIADESLLHGAIQKRDELAGLLDILIPRKPRLIVEIGCDAGGTLYAWQQVADYVFGMTLKHGPYSTGKTLVDHGAVVAHMNSHSDAAYRATRMFKGEVDMLFIDGDHTYIGAKQDYIWYRNLIKPGGMIVLHDICHHEDPEIGVEQLWKELYGEKQEITYEPLSWGGIGILYQ